MKWLDAARERPVVWTALLFAVLAGGYFGFHALFVKVSRTVEMPFSGPARHDNYYVLGRYLQERGLEVEATRSWPQPLTDDTALFWFTDDALPSEVRPWLAAGGRLWSFSDPDSTSGNPWDALFADSEPTDAGVSDGGASDGALADGGVPNSGPTQSDAGSSGVGDAFVDAGADAGEAAAGDDYDDYIEEGCGDDGCLDAEQFEYGTGCFTLVAAWGLWNEQVHTGKTPARDRKSVV